MARQPQLTEQAIKNTIGKHLNDAEFLEELNSLKSKSSKPQKG